MKTKKCENHCPKCNSTNVDWEISDFLPNGEISQNAQCLDCGCQFREYSRYYETEWEK